MSIPPSSFSAAWHMWPMAAWSSRSAATAKARPPAAAMRPTVAPAFSAVRPCTATRAPDMANSSAIAAPMPLDAPVTKALFPLRSTCIGLLLRGRFAAPWPATHSRNAGPPRAGNYEQLTYFVGKLNRNLHSCMIFSEIIYYFQVVIVKSRHLQKTIYWPIFRNLKRPRPRCGHPETHATA